MCVMPTIAKIGMPCLDTDQDMLEFTEVRGCSGHGVTECDGVTHRYACDANNHKDRHAMQFGTIQPNHSNLGMSCPLEPFGSFSGPLVDVSHVSKQTLTYTLCAHHPAAEHAGHDSWGGAHVGLCLSR
jgi:hypothetical protein